MGSKLRGNCKECDQNHNLFEFYISRNATTEAKFALIIDSKEYDIVLAFDKVARRMEIRSTWFNKKFIVGQINFNTKAKVNIKQIIKCKFHIYFSSGVDYSGQIYGPYPCPIPDIDPGEL